MNTATITRQITETIDGLDSTLTEAFETTTTKVAENTDAFTTEFVSRLEQIEANVPELPKKVVAYNRVVAERMFEQARKNNEYVVDAVRPVVKVADTGARTVVGTAKWAAEQTADTAGTGVRTVVDQVRTQVEQTTDTATTGARTVVGQARAQVERTVATFGNQAGDVVTDTTKNVTKAAKSTERKALASMKKDELLKIAQDLDIDGRTKMTKAQLIAAING